MESILPHLPPQSAQKSQQVLANISFGPKLSEQTSYGELPSPLSQHQSSEYDHFLGIEMNPFNTLYFQTIMYGFVAQVFLFYGTRYLFPSLVKNRRGTAWVLTFFCSVFLFSVMLPELGQLRFTLFEMFGLDSKSLGISDDSTVFTYWLPSLYNWVQHVNTGAAGAGVLGSATPGLDQFSRTLLPAVGHFLNWFMSLPIFSLASLKPPAIIDPNMPYYLGGGGRLLLSFETLPRDTSMCALAAGWFVAYAVVDLILGMIHCREMIDPLSGYVHHVMYIWFIHEMTRKGLMSYFMLVGSAAELSTVPLSIGFMFPHLRSDFLFGTSFFLLRIVFLFASWHELYFNVPKTGGGSLVLLAAFFLHCFWFKKFIFNVLKTKKKEAKKIKTEKLHELE